MKKRRPHIIIFNPDQMRCDVLHHMGNAAAVTPNLDAFSERDAVSFRNAYCQNPVCTPSRCSFLTGLYPHVYGHRTISHMLEQGQSSLFKELKNAGYYVWMNGRNDFLAAQREGIFEEHVSKVDFGGSADPNPLENPDWRGNPGEASYYSFLHGKIKDIPGKKHISKDDDDLNRAMDIVRNRPKDQPLCLFLGLFYPHPPYSIEEPYYSSIDRTLLPKRIPKPESWEGLPATMKALYEAFHMEGWGEEQWQELQTVYLAMCSKVDNQFGHFLQVLKEEGIYDDCAIFFFSDHGDFTGDYGIVEKAQNVFTHDLINVPFLIKPPAWVSLDAGISDSLVELLDLYPTVMEWAGVTPDHTQFGKSLSHVVADRTEKHRDYVYCEGGRLLEERHCTEEEESGGLNPAASYYPRISIQAGTGPEHGKGTMAFDGRYKYVERLYEENELYDCRTDPQNVKNLVNDADMQKTVWRFKEELLRWYQETCDIVPYHPDSRFSREQIAQRVHDPKQLEEIYRKLDDGVPSQNIYMKLPR